MLKREVHKCECYKCRSSFSVYYDENNDEYICQDCLRREKEDKDFEDQERKDEKMKKEINDIIGDMYRDYIKDLE